METYVNKINKIMDLIAQEYNQEAREKLQELRSSIIYDIAVQNCKGNKNHQLKNAKALLKNSMAVNENRLLFHKIYKIDDSYQLCDGFVAIVLKDMIEGLELNNADGEYLDCRKIINDYERLIENEYEKTDIDIVQLEQQAIMERKAIYNPVNLKNLYFSPINLLRAIRILGTENVQVYVHISSNIKPAYLKSELGKAIVLPYRPSEKS